MPLSRREFLTSAAAASALAAAARGQAPASAPVPAAPTIAPDAPRPNILYIIMEDTGPQFGCYGEPLVKTPHLDQLAAESVRYSRCYCTSPVCSVSRSALMTGCFPTAIASHQHRTWPWRQQALPAPTRHICDWFRAAGYFTCNIYPTGKRGGLHGSHGNGKLDLNFKVSEPQAGDPFDGNDWSQRRSGQPFFAHITIFETHKGRGWQIARQQPKDQLVNPDAVKLPPYYPDHPVARDEYANYLDVIHLSDGYVGELLARLKQDGLAENTIVVLSSDHGQCLFRSKQFLYDGGMHIPLLIRFPDRRGAGTVDAQFVSGVDFAPTMLGFAGITPPAGAMHGRDLFAAGARAPAHVFAARDRMDISIDRMRAVRTDRFKYIRNYLPAVPYQQPNPYKEQNYATWNLVKQLNQEHKLTPEAAAFAAAMKPIEELFDLAADPHEVHNLAADPAHAQTLKELRGLVDEWMAKYDRAIAYEDPVDIYRGYWGQLPEDGSATKPSATGRGA